MSHAILSKIRKILTLAKDGCYPHEAEAALSKAQRLMLQHNITHDQVEQYQEEAYVTQSLTLDNERIPDIQSNILCILDPYFNIVASYVNTNDYKIRLDFFGSLDDLEVAWVLYEYLEQQYICLWDKYYRQQKLAGERCHRGTRASYMRGITEGIVARLIQERQYHEKQTHLVIVEPEPLKKARSGIMYLSRQPKNTEEAFQEGFQHGYILEVNKNASVR